MGKFSELDLDDDDPYFDSAWPTNEARPLEGLEEVRMQMSAVISDLDLVEKELLHLLDRWKYYNDPPDLETLERILSHVKMARRTLL
jgi:hypothetical protein